MEKQNLVSVQEVRIALYKIHSLMTSPSQLYMQQKDQVQFLAQNKLIQELEGQLESANEELKMEKQTLLSVLEVGVRLIVIVL